MDVEASTPTHAHHSEHAFLVQREFPGFHLSDEQLASVSQGRSDPSHDQGQDWAGRRFGQSGRRIESGQFTVTGSPTPSPRMECGVIGMVAG